MIDGRAWTRVDGPSSVPERVPWEPLATSATPAIGDEVLLAFASYSWPGNVRELQNVIERAVALGTGPVVDLADLPLELQLRDTPAAAGKAADP